MLTLVSKDSVKNSDHFDVLCVLIACMVLEIINQMSKNQKSSLIVWNTVVHKGEGAYYHEFMDKLYMALCGYFQWLVTVITQDSTKNESKKKIF